ncbi:MAG: SEC-C domain-containing protein [Planctomycetes bacterium]|nr:SEC-C domain-containing protein [Planctomycetota bacterium]
MTNKPERNDPCPCGSGKKYKKCCQPEIRSDIDGIVPADMKTNTPLDAYMTLLNRLIQHVNDTAEYDNEAKEFILFEQSISNKLPTGPESGISDGLYMGWMYLDWKFGLRMETAGERFLGSTEFKMMSGKFQTLAGQLVKTYCAFYEIVETGKNWAVLEELVTGTKWKLNTIDDPEEHNPVIGDIWFLRLAGPPESCYMMMSPYIYTNNNKESIVNSTAMLKNAFIQSLEQSIPPGEFFRKFSKEAIIFWIGQIYGHDITDLLREKPIAEKNIPELRNTDSEPLRFSETYFRILQPTGIAEKLSGVRDINYDEQNKIWVWFEKGNKSIPFFPTTTLGTFRIEGGCLITETNSVERALKLKGKLVKALGSSIAYEKIEAKDFGSMPPIPEEKKAEIEQSQRELMANPKIREALNNYIDTYYFDNWINLQLPGLGNKSPADLLETEEGRKKVAGLIDHMATLTAHIKKSDPFYFNFDRLRRKLGLIK